MPETPRPKLTEHMLGRILTTIGGLVCCVLLILALVSVWLGQSILGALEGLICFIAWAAPFILGSLYALNKGQQLQRPDTPPLKIGGKALKIGLGIWAAALIWTTGKIGYQMLYGWANAGPDYSEQFIDENYERQDLGLRTVDDYWVSESHEFGVELWRKYTGGPVVKRVYRDPRGVILSERDYYPSGLYYNDGAKDAPERIIIEYDYTDRTYEYTYEGSDSQELSMMRSVGGTGTSRIVTVRSQGQENSKVLKVVDKILVAWGQSRLR